MRHTGLYLFIILLIFLAPAASASFIRLDTSVATDIEKNSLGLKISVSNKGDEPAHDVQAEIVIGKEVYFSHKQPTLEIARTLHFNQSYPAKIENQGVYPVIVIIHYSDANGYPFSALLCRTFSNHQNAPVAEIFGEMAPVTLSKKGKIKLTLKNTGKSEIKTTTTLIAPKEFKISRSTLSRFAGSRWNISTSERCPDLWSNLARVLANNKYFTKAAKDYGIWDKVQKTIKIKG